MQNTLIDLWGVQITGWKIIGYTGVLLFSARWLVQVWASRKAKKPVVPVIFWIMSMIGSLLCLAYFVWGKNDSVGILAYLFPSVVSAYNLYLEMNHRNAASNNDESSSSKQAVDTD